jgi:magnesium chelatase family protein
MTKYQKRILGPLLDQIDIHMEVPRVDYQKLSDNRLGEASDVVRCRVEKARALQRRRFSGERESRSESRESRRLAAKFDALSIVCNADMRVGEIRQFCQIDAAGESLVRDAMGQ